jgi:hypothetical protein
VTDAPPPAERTAAAETPPEDFRSLEAVASRVAGFEPNSVLIATVALAGDVGRLSRRGANDFLLHQLGRWRVVGLDLPTYAERIRAAYREERGE